MAENKWVTGVITILTGVITPLLTGRGVYLVLSWKSKSTICLNGFYP